MWTSVVVQGAQLPTQGVLMGLKSTVSVHVQHWTRRLGARYLVPIVLGTEPRLLKRSYECFESLWQMDPNAQRIISRILSDVYSPVYSLRVPFPTSFSYLEEARGIRTGGRSLEVVQSRDLREGWDGKTRKIPLKWPTHANWWHIFTLTYFSHTRVLLSHPFGSFRTTKSKRSRRDIVRKEILYPALGKTLLPESWVLVCSIQSLKAILVEGQSFRPLLRTEPLFSPSTFLPSSFRLSLRTKDSARRAAVRLFPRPSMVDPSQLLLIMYILL